MSLKLNSSGGGSVTLQEPVTASAFTLTLPAQTATVITDSSAILNIGSGQIYKDASGNVGIGTSSPASKLHVTGGIGSTGGNVVSTGAAITVYYDTANDYGVTSTLSNGVAWKPYVIRAAGMFFNTSSDAEGMRITSGGNLLIGATTQIQSEKLGVTAGSANATQYQTISTRGGSTLFVNQQQTTSVSTSAVTILNGPQFMNFCLVYGTDGTNRFADVVLMSVGTGTVNVISSLSAAGSPAARTYSQASSTFRLAMASGTYTVQVTCLAMGT